MSITYYYLFLMFSNLYFILFTYNKNNTIDFKNNIYYNIKEKHLDDKNIF